MFRTVCLYIFAAALAAAQDAPRQDASAPGDLPMLAQAVQDKTAEWNKLAGNLDQTILHLLPCDPKAGAAITEVSKASEARLAAIAAYLEAADRQAQVQASSAKQMADAAAASGADLAAEKSDMAAERAGADGQSANLVQAGQQRPSFIPAENTLKQIASFEQQRSAAIDMAISHAGPAAAAMRDLAAQLDARQAAWKDAQTAFAAERDRWSGYYAARIARARMECAAMGGAAPARAQGKQK